MNVSIDYDLCMGEGSCARVCPEVFTFDEGEMRGVVTRAEVPTAWEERVRQAADECGARAVVLTK